MGWRRSAVIAALPLLLATPAAAQKTSIPLPVLVPLTGFAAAEGISQKNGVTLAEQHIRAERQIRDVRIEARFLDTQSSPEAAGLAWDRAVRNPLPPAVVGSVVGAEMLALMQKTQQVGVPLITISDASRLSAVGNPYLFRFVPSDTTSKAAQARYAVEKLGAKRPVVIYQSTADGQSGKDQLSKTLTELNAKPVLEEGVAPTAADLAAVFARAKAAKADVIVLDLHAPSTILAVRQARQAMPDIPVVAGSVMHQPSTAAKLEPAELKGVCAETPASPVSATDGPMKEFADAYRQAFKSEPDAFAAAQYDAVQMLATIVTDLRKASADLTPIAVRGALSREIYKGLVTTYKSDGKGNMAHEAEIVCYDGTSRVPKVVERYSIK